MALEYMCRNSIAFGMFGVFIIMDTRMKERNCGNNVCHCCKWYEIGYQLNDLLSLLSATLLACLPTFLKISIFIDFLFGMIKKFENIMQ